MAKKTKTQKFEKAVAEHEQALLEKLQTGGIWENNGVTFVAPRVTHRKSYFAVVTDPAQKESELAKVEAMGNICRAVLNGELDEFIAKYKTVLGKK